MTIRQSVVHGRLEACSPNVYFITDFITDYKAISKKQIKKQIIQSIVKNRSRMAHVRHTPCFHPPHVRRTLCLPCPRPHPSPPHLCHTSPGCSSKAPITATHCLTPHCHILARCPATAPAPATAMSCHTATS